MTRKVLLDVDVGIDDALALILAVRSPELDVVAVSAVAGNVELEKTTANSLRVLDAVGETGVPVYRGCAKPLVRGLVTAEHVHGRDGLGDIGLKYSQRKPQPEGAVTAFSRIARELGKGVLTVVATGPLTNVASALTADPELASFLREIVVMGGAYALNEHGHGNVTPVAEYNVYADPEAAKIVFESGAKVTALGLDVTTQPDACLRAGLNDEIASKGTVSGKLASSLAGVWVNRWGRAFLHDPMAVAYAAAPHMFEARECRVEVETRGEYTLGETVADRRVYREDREQLGWPTVNVCTRVDGPGFLRLFADRVSEA
ncbi:MAG: nucleoside hydrolase [Thermoprotei archaeon]